MTFNGSVLISYTNDVDPVTYFFLDGARVRFHMTYWSASVVVSYRFLSFYLNKIKTNKWYIFISINLFSKCEFQI